MRGEEKRMTTTIQRTGLIIVLFALSNVITHGPFLVMDFEAWITIAGLVIGATMFIYPKEEEKK